MNKKTFSLVELIVVISIMTVLLSLMIKTLGSTLEKSRSLECSQHLKSQGQGVAFYSEDNSQVLPSMNTYYEENGEKYTSNRHVAWKFQIGNYVNGHSDINYADHAKRNKDDNLSYARATYMHSDLISGVFECPSVDVFENDKGQSYDDIHDSRKGGYGWNYRLDYSTSRQDIDSVTSDLNGLYDYGVHSNRVNRPEETFMLGDTLNRDVSLVFPQVLYHPNRMGKKLYMVHNYGINTLFADMHVENMNDLDIRTSRTDEEYYFRFSK